MVGVGGSTIRKVGRKPMGRLRARDSLHQAWVGFVTAGTPGWRPAGPDCHGRRYNSGDATDGAVPLDQGGPAACHPFRPTKLAV
jgi:hypothetical protein